MCPLRWPSDLGVRLVCGRPTVQTPGWVCSAYSACCHNEIDGADQTPYLTQSQYTDTGLTSPSVDPATPGAWQGSPWVTGMTSRGKRSTAKAGIEHTSAALEVDALPPDQRGSHLVKNLRRADQESGQSTRRLTKTVTERRTFNSFLTLTGKFRS